MKYRKYLLFIVFILIVPMIFSACKEKEEEIGRYEGYFNSFESGGAFSELETLFSIENNTSIVSYDFDNDVYVTARDYYADYYESLRPVGEEYVGTDTAFLFGLYSSDGVELFPPAFLNIIMIKGDYAIVVRPAVESYEATFADVVETIGVVKFRGENKGYITSFEGIYTENFTQMTFVGDYLAVNNSLDDIPSTISDSTNCVTFYNYKLLDKPLEAFRIRADITYKFSIYENYLVSTTYDRSYFYNLDGNIMSTGYLEVSDIYNPFPEDTDGSYTSSITTSVFYLGNGWFVRTAYFKHTENFLEEVEEGSYTGHLMLMQLTGEDGTEYDYYVLYRCDRYNANTKTVLTGSDWFLADLVANEHNSDTMHELTQYMNNKVYSTEYSDGVNKIDYMLPTMPVSEFAKKGMSVAYYYYFPYDNNSLQYEMSFCFLDKNGNTFMLTDIIMPLFVVDGIGIQSSDPDYDYLYGNFEIVDYMTGEKKIFKEYTYGKYTYETVIAHCGVVIGTEVDITDTENPTVLYGAFNYEGTQITEFKYTELTPFYGDYALGMRDDGTGKVGYYRIDKEGRETKLDDLYCMNNGVYITTNGDEENEKVGLKLFDGTVLLPNEYDSVSVVDDFLVDGTFQKSRVIAIKDGSSTAFILK